MKKPKMRKWDLVPNMMFNCNHVIQDVWWMHLLTLGAHCDPVASCEAETKEEAEAIFIKQGRLVGLGFEIGEKTAVSQVRDDDAPMPTVEQDPKNNRPVRSTVVPFKKPD